MSVAELAREGSRLLGAAHLPSATVDARLLLAHVLGVDAAQLLSQGPVPPQDAERYRALLARRAAGEPLQHLTGRAWFRHVEVEVGPGVFLPRPETEVMTGWAVDRLREHSGVGPAVVVELCTGSGVIAEALADELPGLDLHAVELSEDAIAYAERNLAGAGVDLRQGDLADAFRDHDGAVDLVIANPPYIPLDAFESVPAEVRDHDPALALFSGADGLDALRVVAAVAARLLRPGGLVCAEHAEVQSASVVELFARQGTFFEVRDHEDLTGRPRFVTGRRI